MNTADDFDDLSRACFTIPCGPVPTQAASSSSASASLPAGAFPCLSGYETSPLPAQLRRQAHALAAAALDAALERTLDALYAPLLAGLKTWAAPAAETFWLPGAAPLPAAALLGSARHASLPARLSTALLGKSKNNVFVELAASEYDSLHSAQSLLLRRARRDITLRRNESVAQGKRKEEGIDDLLQLGIETLFVSLPALPSHPPAALQDLLTSLASASRGSGTRVCLLFWLPSAPALSQRGSTKASGIGSLGEALPLPAAVRKLCEIQSFTLPTTSETWDSITLQLHMNKHHVPPIWLGPTLWEQIERGFHDVDGRVESVWRALQLAVLDHFSADPFSTLLCKSIPPADAFTPSFYARLRQLLLSAVESHGRVPPRPSSAVDLHPRAHFELLLTSDEHLLATMSEVAQAQRSATRTRNLGLQAIAALDSKLELGQAARPRPGQLWSALLSGSIASLISTLCSALHAAPLARLLSALDELDGLIHREHGPAWLSQEAKEWQAKLGEQKDEAMDVDGEEGRVERVHRQLVREESLSDAKKELVAWLRRSLHTLCVAPHELAFAEIFVYDDAGAIASLLEPAPRAILLAALNDPWAFLESGLSSADDAQDDEDEDRAALQRAQAVADVPDVCRAYVLYRDAGRLLNLADWYNAFAQGIEAQARQRDGAHAEVDEDETQARFAQSVSELAALGFLRRTGRKPEHVSKTVFDLPPSKVKAKAGGAAKSREASVHA